MTGSSENKRFIKGILAVLAVLLACSPFLPAFAGDGAAEEGSSGDFWANPWDIQFAGDDQYNITQSIPVKFEISLAKGVYEYDFPYSDDFFRVSSTLFGRRVAQGSLGLAISAFRNENDLKERQYETYLKAAGFSDIYGFGYDQATTTESLSGVIAHKQVDDFTVLACAACGQRYGKEWASNLKIGEGKRHEGFEHGARIMEEQIAAYREKYHITGKIKVWISGFSRAAAVGNITAADLIDSGEYEDVYAYLFGVPRTTKERPPYHGIYNICGPYDPVPNVPLEAWGYVRYGTDLFMPAQETKVDYASMRVSASEVCEDITGKALINSPWNNHQIYLVMEFMEELFPSGESYIESMQDVISRIWTEPDPSNFLNILLAATQQMDALDRRQEYSRQIFEEYLSWMITDHLSGDPDQVQAGYWDPDISLPANLLREHQPLTYLAWIFSDNDAEEVFNFSNFTHMVTIGGDIDLEIYQGDTYIGGINRAGIVNYPVASASEEDIPPRLYMTKNGESVILMIPGDDIFRLVLTSEKQQFLTYNDFVYSAGIQSGFADYINAMRVETGTYELTVDPVHELGALTVISGSTGPFFHQAYDYSPSLAMRTEYSQEDHVPIAAKVIRLVSALGFFLGLLGIFCLIIAIIHFVKKRHGKGPFSDWWVIIPHLLLVVAFAILTQFCVKNLYVIDLAKAIPATATAAMILLLSIRAFFRNKCRANIIRILILAGFTLLTYFIFCKTTLTAYSIPRLILYILCTAALSVYALRGFFRKK